MEYRVESLMRNEVLLEYVVGFTFPKRPYQEELKARILKLIDDQEDKIRQLEEDMRKTKDTFTCLMDSLIATLKVKIEAQRVHSIKIEKITRLPTHTPSVTFETLKPTMVHRVSMISKIEPTIYRTPHQHLNSNLKMPILYSFKENKLEYEDEDEVEIKMMGTGMDKESLEQNLHKNDITLIICHNFSLTSNPPSDQRIRICTYGLCRLFWSIDIGRKAHLLEDKQILSVGVFDEVSFYTLFQALGWLLEEIYVTWAHLEKKRTRLRLYSKPLKKLCIQSVETASRVLSDGVRTFEATALSFDTCSNTSGICNDPYLKDLHKYSSEFENEVAQLANDFELRIGKKGIEKEEERECHLDGTYYDPPEVSVETFEVKHYSFDNMKSFVCVKKMLKDELPISRVNRSRFKKMIRKEIDIARSVQRAT
ncbi:hypothetical protein Tco_0540011 [Tanacetum coccineum]